MFELIAVALPSVGDSGVGQAVSAVVAGIAIVLGGELFTTGTEWLAEAFGLGEGTAGSVVAALATTLPETLIPVLAILEGRGGSVGVGAILGGPITLTTIALSVLGATATVEAARGRRSPSVAVNPSQTTLDLRVFLVGLSLGALTGLLSEAVPAFVVAAVLVGIYAWYLYRVVDGDVDGEIDPEPLELGAAVGRARSVVSGGSAGRDYATAPSTTLVVAQVLLALGLLVGGSHLFVGAVEWVAESVLRLPAVVVALLLAPLISNVPENVDGVIWIREDEDVLAVEQVTGTLAFQGTVAVAIGVAFTPWDLGPAWGTSDFLVTAAVGIALFTGFGFYLGLRHRRESVLPRLLVALGLGYGVFLALVATYAILGYV